jgi:hypothetical protein
MGAHPYLYVVDFREDVQAALDQLRQEVFAGGAYYGADQSPRSPEEALELAGETGTRSILDITRVADEPDYMCAAPFSREELIEYFGTATPTAVMVEGCHPLWEDLERGTVRHRVRERPTEESRLPWVLIRLRSRPSAVLLL